MPSMRQDAWSADEDDQLADIVLQRIRTGSTQLAGFAEAGNRLSRTPAACGFRWNSTVRKRYADELQKAKRLRKQQKEEKRKAKRGSGPANADHSATLSPADIEQLILILNQLKTGTTALPDTRAADEWRHLLAEHQRLNRDYQLLVRRYEDLQKNYQSLLHVLNLVDQARKNLPANAGADGGAEIPSAGNGG